MTDDIRGINSNPLHIKRLNLKQQNHKRTLGWKRPAWILEEDAGRSLQLAGMPLNLAFSKSLFQFMKTRFRSYFPFLLLKNIRLQKRKSRLEMLFHSSANHQTSWVMSPFLYWMHSYFMQNWRYILLRAPTERTKHMRQLTWPADLFQRNPKDIVKQP